MKKKQRFDSFKFKATKDENGFLYDTPIVARIGIQEYATPSGGIRREFRPASEVFCDDSLSSFKGKPITLGHIEVDSDNAKGVMVGACTGSAYREYIKVNDDEYKPGIGVLCPITIHDGESIRKAESGDAAELSVGYTTIEINQPGWGNVETGEFVLDSDTDGAKKFDSIDFESDPAWQRFDAVQTNIRVNHIAMVFRGRAGIAKLNLDSEQEFPYYTDEISIKEDKLMTVKIKLDGAIEFDVPKEVAGYIESIKASAEEVKAKADGLEAERDTLKAEVEAMPEKIKEAVEAAKAEAEEHAEIVKAAEEVGVKTDGLSAKEIKIAFVRETTGADISSKSDAYIDVAFDLAKTSDKMASQRLSIKGDASEESRKDSEELTPASRLAKLNK